MWYVYILKSENYKKSYVGCTDNITRRLEEHNAGRSTYTKRYKPWKLLRIEEFATRKEAKKKELFYKTGVGRQKLKEFFD